MLGIENTTKSYEYDHVFWSCGGFQKREDGYLEPDGPKSRYADQVISFYCIRLYIVRIFKVDFAK